MKRLIALALCAALAFQPIGTSYAAETVTESLEVEETTEASETESVTETSEAQQSPESRSEGVQSEETEETDKAEGSETETESSDRTTEEAETDEETSDSEASSDGDVVDNMEETPEEETSKSQDQIFREVFNYEIVEEESGSYIKVLGLKDDIEIPDSIVIPKGLEAETQEEESEESSESETESSEENASESETESTEEDASESETESSEEDASESETESSEEEESETDLIPIKVIESGAFTDRTELTEVLIFAELDSVGDETFKGCTSLTTVENQKIEKIGKSAFEGCTSLETIDLSDTVELNDRAFYGCESLNSVEADKLEAAGKEAFKGDISLYTVSMNALEKIEGHMFEGCTNLYNTSFDAVKELGAGSFEGCTALYSADWQTVEKIGNAAFTGCTRLSSIAMPVAVSLGTEAFAGCTNLRTAEFAGEVRSIGSGVFSGCSNLRSIKINTDVESVPNNFASGCTYLSTLEFSDKITSIGNYAFQGCRSLSGDAITEMMKNAETIGVNAFQGCTQINSVEIPESVENINDYAFADCTGLTEVKISDKTIRINEGAFSGCSALTEVRLPDTMIKLGDEAFADCTRLTKINIPGSLEKAGKYIFENDKNLTNITFSSNLKMIPAYLFYGSAIQSIEIPQTVLEIDTQAFYENENLTSVKIPNKNMKFLSDEIFSGNSKLTLYGYIGSTTEKYAVGNGLQFDVYAEVDTTEISLNYTQAELEVDGTLQLEISYLPLDATRYRTAVYTSSDEKIVTVSSDGAVKALLPGTAVVTSKTENGLQASCEIMVNSPAKPETTLAVTNVQSTLKSVDLGDNPKWKFEQPDMRLSAVSGCPEQEYAAVYTNDNGDVLKDTISVKVVTVNGVTAEGGNKVSLSGKDAMDIHADIDTVGAELPKDRYELVWSSENKNISIQDNKDGSATVTGVKAGKDTLTLELYILNAESKRVTKEENVNYFKVTKQIEVVDAPVIRGLYFSQTGLSESMLETDDLHGVTSITMLPENKVNKFTISAKAYAFDAEAKATYLEKRIKYKVSNKEIAKVTANKDGSASVTVLGNGVVDITATVADSGYSENLRLAIVDYMPRLSTDQVTMNLYKTVPDAVVSIYPAYEDYYQCKIVDEELAVVYIDKAGHKTASEFAIAKNDEANGYTISVKDGVELKKGQKKVYLAVTVRGSANVGSQTHYLPLTIKLKKQKPKVEYRKETINPFYKDSKGKLTVISEDADIASVVFTPSAKDKAGLETTSVADKVNELLVVPNQALRKEYTNKYVTAGTLQIKFAGYKDEADITVKNFKLAADNKIPTVTAGSKDVIIYSQMSDTVSVRLYGENGNVLSGDYAISWKNDKDKNKEFFSIKQSKEQGLVNITSLASKDGKLVLTVSAANWSKPVDLVLNVKVKTKPAVALSDNKIILNQNMRMGQKVPVGISVVGNENAKITNVELVPKNKEKNSILKYVRAAYSEADKQVLFSVTGADKLKKDVSEKYEIIATLEQDGKAAQATADLQIKMAVKKPSVKVKVSGAIDVVNREKTYALCAVNIENISGKIQSATLKGDYADYFTATVADSGKNQGKIMIHAKSAKEDLAYIRSDITYKMSLVCKSDNGATYTTEEFKLPVKQTKLKFTTDVKNIDMYGVTEGMLYGKTIQFSIKNNAKEQITNVQLVDFADIFGFKYIGSGKGILYVQDLAKFTAKKSYKLKFAITTQNGFVNADPVTVSVKVTNKRAKVGDYDNNHKTFILNVDNMVYDCDSDVYYIINKVEKLTGSVNGNVTVIDAAYKILDGRDNVLASGSFDAKGDWEITNVAFTFAEQKLILSGKLSDGSEVNEVFNLYVILDEEGEKQLDQNDDDGDGLVNYLEDYYNCDRNNPDTDGDGLTDFMEAMVFNTDPTVKDTDGDGLSDYDEIYSIGTDPTLADTDGNGILDGDEDADGDGLTNAKELELGTDPMCADTDGDRLEDGQEVNTYHTNPLNEDTDGDGILDGNEVKLGLDPNNTCTDGVTPDAKRTFSQALTKNELGIELTRDNAAVPSLSGNVPDLIADHVMLEEVDVLALDDNRAAVGKQVHIDTDYPEGTDMTLTFDCSDQAEKAEALLICKYEDGMIVPCETKLNKSNLSTNVSEGDYFVIDCEKLLSDLDIPVSDYISPDYIEETEVTDNTDVMFKAIENTNDIENLDENSDNAVSSEWYQENYVLVDADNKVVDEKEIMTQDSGLHYVLSSTLDDDGIDEVMALASTGKVSGQADIVFAIDSTGSMSGAINNVVRNIDTFVDTLSTNYDVKVNFALIDFKDITCNEETVLVKNGKANWFSDVKSFKQHVNSIVVTGGGDIPETPIDALGMAYEKLDFRKNANKFIILITDADYKNDNNYGIESMDDMTDKLKKAGICTSVISSRSYESIYHNLYTETEGIFADIYGDFATELLKLADKIGEKVNDGTWVLLSDFQYIKLSNTTDDTDGDGLKDYDELGAKVEIPLLNFIKKALEAHHVPYSAYAGAETVTVYKYISNPVLRDTDFDGIEDPDDENRRSNKFTAKLNYKYKSDMIASDAMQFSVDYSQFFKDNKSYNSGLAKLTALYASNIYRDTYVNVTSGLRGELSTRTADDDSHVLGSTFGLQNVQTLSVGYKTGSDGKLVYDDDGKPIPSGEYTTNADDITEATIGHRLVEYNGTKKEIFVLTVRGTNGTDEEWSSNFDVGADTEGYLSTPGISDDHWRNKANHKGFDVAANRLYDKVESYINNAKMDEDTEKAILITGHSRGAAIANILGAKYESKSDIDSYTYAFATPNTTTSPGNYKTIWNLVNQDDLVPYLPLASWKFEKYGTVLDDISVNNAYKDEWKVLSNLRSKHPISNGYSSYGATGVKDTEDVLGKVVNSREELYEYDTTDDGTVNIGNKFYFRKESAQKRVDELKNDLDEYRMGRFCNVYIKDNKVTKEVVVNYKPAYLLQLLSNVATRSGSMFDSFDNALDTAHALTFDTKGRYAKAKGQFVKQGLKMTHPHMPITYCLLSQKID